jgi:hypothetical protein
VCLDEIWREGGFIYVYFEGKGGRGARVHLGCEEWCVWGVTLGLVVAYM